MVEKKFKYIYGPVYSWRLGVSLGIDLLGEGGKICNFDCIYCQLGRSIRFNFLRKRYVSSEAVIQELKNLPQMNLDYITFSGSGEPTLAENLGSIVNFIKKHFKTPLAILTNSSLLTFPKVQKDLLNLDFVCAKLDASSETTLIRINQPCKGINFRKIYQGILKFRKDFKKRFALQIMFIEENKKEALRLAETSYTIMPDEIQINTPLRPSEVKPLTKDEILRIKDIFLKRFKDVEDVRIISVYDERPKKYVKALSKGSTCKRRRVLCLKR